MERNAEDFLLSLSDRRVGPTTVVTVCGEIDIATAPKLRELLLGLNSAAVYQIVLDMEGVAFLDSTALGVIAGCLKRIRAHNGSLKLGRAARERAQSLRVTGLSKVLAIYPTVDAALTDR
jgi:anti-sigma B factor antagonist